MVMTVTMTLLNVTSHIMTDCRHVMPSNRYGTPITPKHKLSHHSWVRFTAHTTHYVWSGMGRGSWGRGCWEGEEGEREEREMKESHKTMWSERPSAKQTFAKSCNKNGDDDDDDGDNDNDNHEVSVEEEDEEEKRRLGGDDADDSNSRDVNNEDGEKAHGKAREEAGCWWWWWWRSITMLTVMRSTKPEARTA